MCCRSICRKIIKIQAYHETGSLSSPMQDRGVFVAPRDNFSSMSSTKKLKSTPLGMDSTIKPEGHSLDN